MLLEICIKHIKKIQRHWVLSGIKMTDPDDKNT